MLSGRYQVEESKPVELCGQVVVDEHWLPGLQR